MQLTLLALLLRCRHEPKHLTICLSALEQCKSDPCRQHCAHSAAATLSQSVHSHHNLANRLPSQHVLYGIYYRLDTGKLLFIHPCLQLALSMQIKQLLSVSWDVLPVSLHDRRNSH